MTDRDRQQAYAKDLSRRLIEHPRWSWQVGLAFRWHGRDLLVVGVPSKTTILAHYINHTAGFEIDVFEHALSPNLLHRITAGVLFERWAREAAFAPLQADRFRLVGPHSPNKEPGKAGYWTLILDPGCGHQIFSDDDLGVVAAQALLGLWRRLDMMTPRTLKAATRGEK